MIKGAQEIIYGHANALSGFEIIDKYTFTITLECDSIDFLVNLSRLNIYPHEVCRLAGEDWGIKIAIGTGPFKFISFDENSFGRVERFENYHGTKPKRDFITFRFFDNENNMIEEYARGNVGFLCVNSLVNMFDRVLKNDLISKDLKCFEIPAIRFLFFNQFQKPWDNIKVREAFSYAIDTSAISEKLFGGKVKAAPNMLSPSVNGFDSAKQLKKYNPAKSINILEEAGIKLPLEVDVVVFKGSTDANLLFELIKEQSKNAGFNINIKEVDGKNWEIFRRTGELPTRLTNWCYGEVELPGYAAPIELFRIFHSNNSVVFSNGHQNKEYDDIIDECMETLDNERRYEFYKIADDILVSKDFAAIPIYYEGVFFLQKPYISNVLFDLW